MLQGWLMLVRDRFSEMLFKTQWIKRNTLRRPFFDVTHNYYCTTSVGLGPTFDLLLMYLPPQNYAIALGLIMFLYPINQGHHQWNHFIQVKNGPPKTKMNSRFAKIKDTCTHVFILVKVLFDQIGDFLEFLLSLLNWACMTWHRRIFRRWFQRIRGRKLVAPKVCLVIVTC